LSRRRRRDHPGPGFRSAAAETPLPEHGAVLGLERKHAAIFERQVTRSGVKVGGALIRAPASKRQPIVIAYPDGQRLR
jgi:hypothetical protein